MECRKITRKSLIEPVHENSNFYAIKNAVIKKENKSRGIQRVNTVKASQNKQAINMNRQITK